MKENQPKFSSEELQAAFESARPSIEGADAAWSKVSRDMKALEDYLLSAGRSEVFELRLGKYFVPEGDGQYVDAAIEASSCASGHIEEESIAWKSEKAGKFRLVYQRHRWEGSIDTIVGGGPLFWDEGTHEVEEKPLIETKWEIRKRMNKYLPDFIRQFGAFLAVELPAAAESAEADEIPF